MATAMMSVLVPLRRKSRSTVMASAAPTSRLFWTRLIALRT